MTEYDTSNPQVLGILMEDMNNKFETEETFTNLYQKSEFVLGQQYMLNKGLKVFGKEGEDTVYKEAKQ